MDISPDKQNVDRVFSNTTYHIDFYQRDYRWTAEPVLRLLDDAFHRFEDNYERLKGKISIQAGNNSAIFVVLLEHLRH